MRGESLLVEGLEDAMQEAFRNLTEELMTIKKNCYECHFKGCRKSGHCANQCPIRKITVNQNQFQENVPIVESSVTK
jgi:hypothetical protein